MRKRLKVIPTFVQFQRHIWGYLGQQDGGGRRGGVAKVALRGQNCSQGGYLSDKLSIPWERKEFEKLLFRCGRLG